MTQTGTIPTGYKKTEIGIIPEDWDVKTLVEVTENVKVGLATSVTKYYRNKGIPIIRNLNIKDGFFEDRDMLYLDEDFAKANLSKSAKGLDVLTVHTGANLGLTCVLPKRYDKCQTFTTLITTPKKSIIDSYYLCYHMGSFFGKKEMNKLEVGGGKGNLNTADLKKYRIFFPSNIKEQKAIARVLSDTDALIESLEKLIAKKKDIKQGTMQQLLTGKKRLPGFSGEWKTKELGTLLKYEQPTKYIVKNTEYNNINLIPVLTAGKSFILGYTNEDYGIYIDIPVIIFDDFTTESKYVTFPFKVKSSAMKILKSRDINVNLRFIYEKMQTIDFLLRDHKRYWISEYQNIKMNIPGFEEQTAIANILSDMDTEIEKMEQKKDKYISLKQGMMQQLLTGKIRLVKNGDN